jgi:hypothetical protein
VIELEAQDLAKRDIKSQNLRVFSIDKDYYFVESSEGKICYKVHLNNGTSTCSCADFATRSIKTPDFKCKHILAAMNTNGNSQKLVEFERQRKLDERFIVNIKGKDFVVYAGLLDLAHQIGFTKMKPEVVQYPNKDNGNTAICVAYLLAKDGREFWDVGDANPKNVNPKVVGHELRMASTRAKARILRDFTNVGMTCLEEIGDLNEVISDEKNASDKVVNFPEKAKTTTNVKPSEKADTSKEAMIAQAQLTAIQKLAEKKKLSVDDLKKLIKDGKPIEMLTSNEAVNLIKLLQKSN